MHRCILVCHCVRHAGGNTPPCSAFIKDCLNGVFSHVFEQQTKQEEREICTFPLPSNAFETLYFSMAHLLSSVFPLEAPLASGSSGGAHSRLNVNDSRLTVSIHVKSYVLFFRVHSVLFPLRLCLLHLSSRKKAACCAMSQTDVLTRFSLSRFFLLLLLGELCRPEVVDRVRRVFEGIDVEGRRRAGPNLDVLCETADLCQARLEDALHPTMCADAKTLLNLMSAGVNRKLLEHFASMFNGPHALQDRRDCANVIVDAGMRLYFLSTLLRDIWAQVKKRKTYAPVPEMQQSQNAIEPIDYTAIDCGNVGSVTASIWDWTHRLFQSSSHARFVATLRLYVTWLESVRIDIEFSQPRGYGTAVQIVALDVVDSILHASRSALAVIDQLGSGVECLAWHPRFYADLFDACALIRNTSSFYSTLKDHAVHDWIPVIFESIVCINFYMSVQRAFARHGLSTQPDRRGMAHIKALRHVTYVSDFMNALRSRICYSDRITALCDCIQSVFCIRAMVLARHLAASAPVSEPEPVCACIVCMENVPTRSASKVCQRTPHPCHEANVCTDCYDVYTAKFSRACPICRHV